MEILRSVLGCSKWESKLNFIERCGIVSPKAEAYIAHKVLMTK